jgi:hypothetical protein
MITLIKYDITTSTKTGTTSLLLIALPNLIQLLDTHLGLILDNKGGYKGF